METAIPPQPRQRPPLRHLLAIALSGGLGVFAFAADSTPIAKSAAPVTPAAVSSVDQPGE